LVKIADSYHDCGKMYYICKNFRVMNTISISEFYHGGFSAYNDDMLISSNIENTEQLRHPCRIKAITFLVCTEGEVKCRINLKDYLVRPNGIIVNFPENIIQVDKSNDFRGYIILISTNYLDQLTINIKKKIDSYMNLKEDPLTYVDNDDLTSIGSFYQLIKENIDRVSDERDYILKGLVMSFVYKMMSTINRYQQHDIASIPNKSNIQKYFDDFMLLLFTYHSSERSIRFYADKMNLTCNYLSCLVKEYSGKPASHWITEYVILEAEVLLKMSGMNVQQVAYKLNFPTQSMFGKYFKRYTGFSPKEYIGK
jgi:AraC family transcriptional activator of pobA